MADVSASFFDASSGRVEVIFQKAKDVIDGELNELQRIQSLQRWLHNAERSTDGVGSTGFSATGSGLANDLTIEPGNYTVHGYTYAIGAPALLSVLMATATPLPTRVGTQTDFVYVDFQLVEVDALADPTIAVTALGETARRFVLRGTWGVGNAALGSPPGAGELLTGGVVRVPVAAVRRIAATAAVAVVDVVTQTSVSRETKALLDASTTLALTANGIVSWNRSTGALYIGHETDTADRTKGLQIVFPGGATYVVQGSWTLAAGQGLFLNPKRFGNVSWPSRTTPLYTSSGVQGDDQNPVFVANLDANAPGLMLAARFESGHLMLRDGRVLRVPANFATNTVKYGSWQGRDEKGNQDILITVGDGVSSFGDFSTLSGALACISGAVGSGASRVRIRLKEGNHAVSAPPASAYLYTFVTASLGTATKIIIEGAGKGVSVVNVDTTNISNAVIALSTGTGTLSVEIRGVSFDITAGPTTIRLFEITANAVVFDDVYINGPALVSTAASGDNVVSLRNSEFVEHLGCTTTLLEATGAGGAGRLLVDGCSFLGNTDSQEALSVIGWRDIDIRDCVFEQFETTSSPLLLVQSNSTHPHPKNVRVRGNRFTPRDVDAGQPLVVSTGEYVDIRENVIEAGSGWYSSVLLEVNHQRSGEAAYVVRSINIRDNHITVTDANSGTLYVIRVRQGATSGALSVDALNIEGNTILGVAYVDGTFYGIDVRDNGGGGNCIYRSGSISRNRIVMDNTYIYNFTGIRFGTGAAFGLETQEANAFIIADNTIRARLAGNSPSTLSVGVHVDTPAKSAVVSKNSIDLARFASLGAASDSVGVRCSSGSQYTNIGGNVIVAEWPVDVSSATVSAYVEGNHTVQTDNVAGSLGGLGANSTFNTAGSYTAGGIGTVTDNKSV